MFKTIAPYKNAYPGRNFVIVGTGPSADYTNEIIAYYHKLALAPIIITINRSIIIPNHVHFAFIDSIFSLYKIEKFIDRTDFLCMPLFSTKKLNFNDDLVKRHQEKILLFHWSYKNYRLLQDTENYSLDDINLFIEWGNSQSALHFIKKCGAKSILFVGCEGVHRDGRLYASALYHTFKLSKRKVKQLTDYKKTRQGLVSMLGLLNIDYYNFVENQNDHIKFANNLKDIENAARIATTIFKS